MIRLSALAALFVLPAALAGCGGSEAAPTDPNQLPPLSAEDRAEMTRHDDEVAGAEKAQMLLSPESKGSKRSRKKIDPNRTEGVF